MECHDSGNTSCATSVPVCCLCCSRPVAHGTLFCEPHRQKRNIENRESQRKRFKRKIRYHKAESYKFRGSKAYERESVYIFRSAILSERIFAAGLQKLSVQLEVKQVCTANSTHNKRTSTRVPTEAALVLLRRSGGLFGTPESDPCAGSSDPMRRLYRANGAVSVRLEHHH